MKTNYAEMPPFRAALQKWSDGQAIHGPVFVGDALAHLYEEQLDAFNYVQQLRFERRFPSAKLDKIELGVQALMEMVWEMLEESRQPVQATANEELIYDHASPWEHCPHPDCVAARLSAPAQD